MPPSIPNIAELINYPGSGAKRCCRLGTRIEQQICQWFRERTDIYLQFMERFEKKKEVFFPTTISPSSSSISSHNPSITPRIAESWRCCSASSRTPWKGHKNFIRSHITILPEAFLTFARKSSIGPSYAAHDPILHGNLMLCWLFCQASES